MYSVVVIGGAILISLVSSIIAYYCFKRIKNIRYALKIRSEGIEAHAIIVDFDITKNSEGAICYHPIFQFQPINGEVVRVISDYGYNIKGEIGSTVKIFYLPSEPRKIAFRFGTMADIGAIIFGICIVLGAFWALFRLIPMLVALPTKPI
jgi:hypothetical protein